MATWYLLATKNLVAGLLTRSWQDGTPGRSSWGGQGESVRRANGRRKHMVDKDRIAKLRRRLQELLSKADRSEADNSEMQRLDHMIGVALQPVEGERAELMQSSVEAAQEYAWKLAKQKELSDLMCLLASTAAGVKARGSTASEFLSWVSEHLAEPNQAISVLKQEDLWPWKGVN